MPEEFEELFVVESMVTEPPKRKKEKKKQKWGLQL